MDAKDGDRETVRFTKSSIYLGAAIAPNLSQRQNQTKVENAEWYSWANSEGSQKLVRVEAKDLSHEETEKVNFLK